MDPCETESASDYGRRFVDWTTKGLIEIYLEDNKTRKEKANKMLLDIKSLTPLLSIVTKDIIAVIAVYHQLQDSDLAYLVPKMLKQQYIAPICRIHVHYHTKELLSELTKYLSVKRDEYKEIHSTKDVQDDYKISTVYNFRCPLEFLDAEISASFCRLWIKGT